MSDSRTSIEQIRIDLIDHMQVEKKHLVGTVQDLARQVDLYYERWQAAQLQSERHKLMFIIADGLLARMTAHANAVIGELSSEIDCRMLADMRLSLLIGASSRAARCLEDHIGQLQIDIDHGETTTIVSDEMIRFRSALGFLLRAMQADPQPPNFGDTIRTPEEEMSGEWTPLPIPTFEKEMLERNAKEGHLVNADIMQDAESNKWYVITKRFKKSRRAKKFCDVTDQMIPILAYHVAAYHVAADRKARGATEDLINELHQQLSEAHKKISEAKDILRERERSLKDQNAFLSSQVELAGAAIRNLKSDLANEKALHHGDVSILEDRCRWIETELAKEKTGHMEDTMRLRQERDQGRILDQSETPKMQRTE